MAYNLKKGIPCIVYAMFMCFYLAFAQMSLRVRLASTTTTVCVYHVLQTLLKTRLTSKHLAALAPTPLLLIQVLTTVSVKLERSGRKEDVTLAPVGL